MLHRTAASLLTLACILGSAHHARAATTIGIEWEFTPNAGVLDRAEAPPGSEAPKDFASDEEVLLCSVQQSHGLPLVRVTYDLPWRGTWEGPTGAHTIEIVTAPIDYDDHQAWLQVTRFVTHFFKTLDAKCQAGVKVPTDYTGLTRGWFATENICFVSAAELAAAMNAARDASVIDAVANTRTGVGVTGQCGAHASQPDDYGFFRRAKPFWLPGKFWEWSSMAVANTQVNVAIKLADVATRPVERLFAGGGVALGAFSAAKERLKSGHGSLAELDVFKPLLGLLLVDAYAANAAAAAASASASNNNYAPGGFLYKNAFDLYPKAPLGDLYGMIRAAQGAESGNQALIEEIENVDGKFKATCRDCAAWDGFDDWVQAFIRRSGKAITIYKPIAPIGGGADIAAVFEMRNRRHPINAAVDLVVNGAELQLRDEAGMVAALNAVFAPN